MKYFTVTKVKKGWLGKTHLSAVTATREQAEKWAEGSVEEPKISERETDSPIDLDITSPWTFYVGLTPIGDNRDCRCSYVSTAHIVPGCEDEAQIRAKFAAGKAEEKKRQDGYYSQPWV